MSPGTITIFGGSGFLGRRVTRHLLASGSQVRVATRHPALAHKIFAADQSPVEYSYADVHDEKSISASLDGAVGAVNAVSLYRERGGDSFRSVHVDAAERVARRARDLKVARLVHVSGIGANAHSHSSYIRSRGEGERAVADAFPAAAIVRPSVMFGPDDAFLTTLTELVRRSPVIPLFGRGDTKLQPCFVDDVGEAIVRILTRSEEPEPVYEFGGPRIYRYRDLLDSISTQLDRRPVLLPWPFPLWQALATASEFVPLAPLTRNQVELMQIDTIAGSKPGFKDLGIVPRSIEDLLRDTLLKRRHETRA